MDHPSRMYSIYIIKIMNKIETVDYGMIHGMDCEIVDYGTILWDCGF